MSGPVLLKSAAALVEVALTLAVSSLADGTAERLVLYSAAGAGLLWFWRNVLRPFARLLHRTVSAVEALEELPGWRQETEERVGRLEDGVEEINNGQQAILRELGIEDKVRKRYPTPEDFFGPS